MTDPQKLGKYEIRRELGRGAMGVVVEAFDPMIERTVALKTIRADQLEGTEAQEIMTRFQREAKAAGRLTHPNIVAVYDYGEDGGTAFIAMEFVRGRSLKDYFDKHERFTIPQVARIMGELLSALGYASKNGIVHRDIKPANIILLEDGTVKVADFGIAHILSSEFTQAGQVLGTPSYMSPEQFMGQTVDGRSDLYSAGVVLYTLLTGERPFTGAATTIMHKVLKEDPLPPSTLNVQVPKPFDAVIRKAMGKRPDDRFQTAQAFAAAINTAADNRMPEGIEISPDATMVAGGDSTFISLDATQAAPAAQATQKMPATDRTVAATMRTAMPTPGAAAPGEATLAARSGSRKNVAVLAVVAVLGIAVALAAWFMASPRTETTTAAATSAPAAVVPAAPAAAPTAVPVAAAPTAPQAAPGTMTFSAMGLADPGNQQFKADPNAAAAAARNDARRQLVEKALALTVDSASLAKNQVLLDKLLARSNEFVANVVLEGAPMTGKDGLVQVATVGTVKVREVQKALNQMSREERVDFIRNNGDPKISVAITVKDETSGGQPSQIAENILKERIQSFGFRIWSDEAKARTGADIAVVGEATVRKLSAKLAASGLTIDKYLLTSWTVKAVDRATGEEIYYNNKLPKNVEAKATREQALADIGTKVADEFSRGFFLQHFVPGGRRTVLQFEGLPGKTAEAALAREVPGLPQVVMAAPLSGGKMELLLMGGNVPVSELVSSAVLAPLNAKLGAACFTLGATAGEEVTVRFDAKCNAAATVARFDEYPPAALYAAPPARRAAVVKNPETAKKLSI
ncbi:MAG: serine/threonine-protein kinase [Burkholderiales bacterium]